MIIRILTPPSSDRLFDQRGGAAGSNRYRRKSEWEQRGRRNSLPTLYEYDLDGGASVRNVERRHERTQEMHTTTAAYDPLAASQSRRTSRSSMRSDGADVRSMSEITVDFARQDVPDNMTDASSYYHPRGSRYYEDYGDDNEYEDRVSLVRSLSQPSLARSASEFIESWGIRDQGWDSPEQSPRSSMRVTTTGGGDPATSTYNVQRSIYQQQEHKTWYEKGDGERL